MGLTDLPSGAERTLLVTENPFLFLRRATCAGTSEAWWIDAICINQEDVLERSGQVRKLGDIYAAAIKVIIWLGDEDEYTAPALQLLNILASVDTNKLVRADSLAQYDEAESKSRELLGMNIDQTYWTALSWFYKRYWLADPAAADSWTLQPEADALPIYGVTILDRGHRMFFDSC
ncbi:MAG: hypothetical protein Q9207_003692 [Kuettlingeria erythrocarpa]